MRTREWIKLRRGGAIHAPTPSDAPLSACHREQGGRELIVAQNVHRPRGTVRVGFEGRLARFDDLAALEVLSQVVPGC